MKKKEHKFVLSIPKHGNRDLKTGLLRQLIKTSGLTVDQFRELIN